MASAAGSRTPAQLFALVFGIVYLAVGLLGFAVTGFDDFFADTGEALILFPVNPAHNLVHILLGAVWLASARAHASAKTVNAGIGAAYVLVFVVGLFGALTWLNIDAGINTDALLHLVSGLAALYFGTAGATASRPATA
jgi:hypothetical protein